MNRSTSDKAARFTESVIREMTRLANTYGAVNLSQGFPDFPAPEELKEAASRAIAANINQYAVTWGAPNLRQAIAAKFERSYGVKVDADKEVTVCCGGTEAMVASMMALLNPGDEVVTFEPFYENYGPDAILAGAVPKFVTLRTPDWSFDPAELRAAFSNKTRAIIMNSPHNPTGKVFTRDELNLIASLCQALGAVLSRKAFSLANVSGENIDGITAAYQRILGGVAVGAVLLLVVKRNPIFDTLLGGGTSPDSKNSSRLGRWRKAWPWVFANGLAGPALGVSCYQWALKTTPTGVVLPIVAITPLVIIPFSYHLEGERPTIRSLAGGALAVIGAAALAWVTSHPH